MVRADNDAAEIASCPGRRNCHKRARAAHRCGINPTPLASTAAANASDDRATPYFGASLEPILKDQRASVFLALTVALTITVTWRAEIFCIIL